MASAEESAWLEATKVDGSRPMPTFDTALSAKPLPAKALSKGQKMSMSLRDLHASLDAAPKSKERRRSERKMSMTAGDGTLWEDTDVKSAPGREFVRGPRRGQSGEGSSFDSGVGSQSFASEGVDREQPNPVRPAILADAEQRRDPRTEIKI